MSCQHKLIVHHDMLREISHAECTLCHKEGVAYVWKTNDPNTKDLLSHAYDRARELFEMFEVMGMDGPEEHA